MAEYIVCSRLSGSLKPYLTSRWRQATVQDRFEVTYPRFDSQAEALQWCTDYNNELLAQGCTIVQFELAVLTPVEAINADP